MLRFQFFKFKSSVFAPFFLHEVEPAARRGSLQAGPGGVTMFTASDALFYTL